jgi:hypothetical protein
LDAARAKDVTNGRDQVGLLCASCAQGICHVSLYRSTSPTAFYFGGLGRLITGYFFFFP